MSLFGGTAVGLGDWQRIQDEIHDGTFFPLVLSLLAHSYFSPPLIFCIENLRTKWSRGESDRWADMTHTRHLRLLKKTTPLFMLFVAFFGLCAATICVQPQSYLSGGCLLVHCLLTVIYFINVPLIEMAAREKRGKSD